MNSFRHFLSSYANQLGDVMRIEFHMIRHDPGVMLIMIFACLIYGTIYSYCYKNQTVSDVPICIIDDDDSVLSRQLAENVDNGDNVSYVYETHSIEEAKKLYYAREIYGVIYIPKGYEKNILLGGQSVVSIYGDASYFLLYRQVFMDLVETISYEGSMTELKRLVMKGTGVEVAKRVSQPIIYQSRDLFNADLGYATYVMPAVLILILQQTALIGIGMIGGTWREYNFYRKVIPSDKVRLSTIPIVAGKSFVYVMIYIVLALYIFGIHYRLFSYPVNGSISASVAVLFPYLLSIVMMGIFVSTFFHKREHSVLFLLWTSIPLLMLSGVSFPKEAIPGWLYAIGQIFPSSDAVLAYVRVQTMGADIRHILPELNALWTKALVYGFLSVVSMHVVLNRDFALKIKETFEDSLFGHHRTVVDRFDRMRTALAERRRERQSRTILRKIFSRNK